MSFFSRVRSTRWRTRISAGVVIAAFSSAIALSLAPPRHRTMSEDAIAKARPLSRALAPMEPVFERRARRHFPGDRWSTDDDFHNMEQRWVRDTARRRGVSVGALFYAIDADIRAKRVNNRKNTASPCKPRPFYD
jgi:hypothetical protein